MRRVMAGTLALGVLLSVNSATVDAADPPAVMIDLGPVVPTPEPTPEPATRKRLVTTITVQNIAGGESVMSFEATDVADKGDGKFQTLAAARYSLKEEEPKLKTLRDRIILQVRALERDLLEYAEVSGPPKERRPLIPRSGGEEEGFDVYEDATE
jgi:hypothetical protein